MPKNTIPAVPLPREGYVRLNQIIGPGRPYPVSKTTWWEGVRAGRYPQPDKLSPGVTAWKVEDIRELIDCPQQTGDQRRVDAKDDDAAQAEAKRLIDDEDEDVDTDTPVAA